VLEGGGDLTASNERQALDAVEIGVFDGHNTMSIEHADFDGIERLALVTGGEIASTFEHPDQVKLGG
jgi:hypothetical protein